jgi:hypothetical protein
VRKATLRSKLAKTGLGLRFNEHMEGDGPTVFAHACKIVSKRKDSVYRSGRSFDWLKMKNPNAPAVKREEEEDCGKGLALIRSRVNAGAKNRPPKEKGRPVWFGRLHKDWCRP